MAASLTVQCSMTSSAIQPSFPPRTPGFRLSPQRSPAALIGTFVSAGTQQSGRAFASTIRRAVITCHGSESHSGKPVPHSHSHSHSHSHPQQVGNVPLSAQNNAEHVEIMHARDANLDSENGQRNQHKEMRKNSIVQLEITHTHKSHAHELHLHLRHPNMQKAMSEKGSSEASAGSYEGNGNGHHHRHHDHDHQHMHDHHHHAHHDDQDIERHSHSHSHLHKHSNEVPSKNNSSDSEGKHGHGSLEPGSRNTQKHNGGSITFAVSSQWRPRNEPMERGAGAGKVLFVDAYTAGVAGDMMVAALLDLGVPWEVLADGLQHLGLGKCRCEVIPTERSAIVATRCWNILDCQQAPVA